MENWFLNTEGGIMSAMAVAHEHPVEMGENHWLKWFHTRQEEARASLTLVNDGRNGRAALDELSNGDPPSLILWGEE